MSQEANKLQMPFSANSIYSRDPISKMSINCRSPFCASNKATSLDINYTQSEINILILGLYYKLNWPKRASAVYWLLGTLLYPWFYFLVL